jgi:hydroxymethylglutaryl-CoA synthase
MTGIVSYGAYIPLYRIGKGTGGWSSTQEKAVANFDEDSITMGTAAAINCLQFISPSSVDTLYFATTSPPYAEKSNATVIAAASGLPANTSTMDFSHSLRAGTSAVKAAIDAISSGSVKQALVVAADMRIAQPRSDFESTLGDGAVSILIGNSNVIAEFIDCYSISHEIQDIWRAEGDKYIRSWEDRFIAEEGYLKAMPEAIKGLMAKRNLKPADFTKVVFYGPDSRRHQQLATLLGFDAKSQVQNPLLNSVGNSGSASALLILAAALEEAKPGDNILVANYGNGADAMIFRVTDHITSLKKDKRGVSAYLNSKKLLPDYEMYLTWRGLFDKAPPQRRPVPRMPSPSAMLREVDKNLRFHGTKCKACGYPQYPPQRICTRCHSKDNFDEYKFAGKPAKVFTYTMDYLAPTADPPMVVAVINFDGGGRAFCVMTDRDIKKVEIGMPVEMTFRKLTTIEGIHNYYWKCMPPR